MVSIVLIVYWSIMAAGLFACFTFCVYQTYIHYRQLPMTETFNPRTIDNATEKLSEVISNFAEEPEKSPKEEDLRLLRIDEDDEDDDEDRR